MTPEEIQELQVKLNSNTLWFDLAKFLIGTVAIGIVTLFLNNRIQQQEVEVKANANETDHLSKFATQYLALTDLDQKREFLEFMITISYSDVTRSRYRTLLDSVMVKIKRKGDFEQTSLEIQASDPRKVEKAQELEKQIFNARALGDTVGYKKKQDELNAIVKGDNNLTKLQELNQSIREVDNSYMAIRKVIMDTASVRPKTGFRLVDSKDDEWIKEGYFRVYEGNYLAVNNLEKRSVSFQLRSNIDVGQGVIADFTLAPGETKAFETGHLRYEIQLIRIGAAGRFPLPKAAIYSIKTFKRI